MKEIFMTNKCKPPDFNYKILLNNIQSSLNASYSDETIKKLHKLHKEEI